jgi:WhiB family redox-sensing transcriptional regulator
MLPLFVTATSWRARARCRTEDVDPELFFPVGTSGPALLQEQEAKSFCRLCPVRAECLEDALEVPAGKDHGIFGGTTADERLAERKRRARRESRQPVTAAAS